MREWEEAQLSLICFLWSSEMAGWVAGSSSVVLCHSLLVLCRQFKPPEQHPYGRDPVLRYGDRRLEIAPVALAPVSNNHLSHYLCIRFKSSSYNGVSKCLTNYVLK